MTYADYYQRTDKPYTMSAGRMGRILELVSKKNNLEILDLGCAGGMLAVELKKLGHTVDGADISEYAIQNAKAYLRDGYFFDFERDSWPAGLMEKKYDVIICSEVIEHLFDPAPVIIRARSLLRDGGCMIISTPNVLFWKNRLCILFGSFEYQDVGLMDFGHIRFFTLATARNFFKKVDLKIEQENHVYPNFHFRGLDGVGSLFPGLFAYQMVFRLSKRL